MGQQKFALVTGASSGIGKAIAIALAKEGYYVFLGGRNVERLQESLEAIGGENHGEYFTGDLTDPIALSKINDTVTAKTNTLHVLVNAAGMFRWDDSFGGGDGEAIDRLSDVNFNTKVALWNALKPLVISAGQDGVVINISSQAANFTKDDPRRKNEEGYVTSMRMVSDWSAGPLTEEVKKAGTHIILLEPGLIDTPLARKNFTAETIGEDPDWAQVPTPEQYAQENVLTKIREALA